MLVAACGSPPKPLPSSHVVENPAPVTWIFRQLTVGALPRAHRTTFALAFEGERATLTETVEHEARALRMADADRDAHWTIASQRTYRGPVRVVGGARELELASDGVQPLQLHCESRAVAVAGAHAKRVASPGRPADAGCGDLGMWEPAATTRIDALVCTPTLQPVDDADDDERFVFGAAPGIEWAFENDDCVLQGGGLRRIAPS